MKKSCAFERHKRFKAGREDVEDDERSDRPRSHGTGENVGKVRNLVHSDRSLNIKAVSVQLIWTEGHVHTKRPELKPNDWILQHWLQQARLALSSCSWPKESITEMKHSTRSPDLAPNDFRLFPKLVCAKETKISKY
jgi:hypothetical protein